MIRKALNVSIGHRPGFWTGSGPAVLRVGKRVFLLRKMSREEFQEHLDGQHQYPRLTAKIEGKRYWQYRGKFYVESDRLNPDQVYALITTREQRKNQQIERAQATMAMGFEPRNSAKRKRIPDDIKQYVWVRDGGQCQSCGATVELQFDHIIPISMGGSSNVENLQVLCGPCNRSKAAGLTTRR